MPTFRAAQAADGRYSGLPRDPCVTVARKGWVQPIRGLRCVAEGGSILRRLAYHSRRTMFEQLLTIARNTFTESVRQPIYAILLVVAGLALLFCQQIAQYTFDDDTKLMLEMGLSCVFLVGAVQAALTASAVLSSEIENRTALTVVSNPIPRPVFVLG